MPIRLQVERSGHCTKKIKKSKNLTDNRKSSKGRTHSNNEQMHKDGA
jgi:hypothetical protein